MSFFNKANDAASRKGIGYAVTATLAVSALVPMCFLAGMLSENVSEIVHRSVMLLLAAVSLLVMAHAFRLRLLLSLRSEIGRAHV